MIPPEGDLKGRLVMAPAASGAATWQAAPQSLRSRERHAGSRLLSWTGGGTAIHPRRNRIHCQHYRPPTETWNDPFLRWPLALVAIQAALVAAGLVSRRSEIASASNARLVISLASGIAMSHFQPEGMLRPDFAPTDNLRFRAAATDLRKWHMSRFPWIACSA